VIEAILLYETLLILASHLGQNRPTSATRSSFRSAPSSTSTSSVVSMARRPFSVSSTPLHDGQRPTRTPS